MASSAITSPLPANFRSGARLYTKDISNLLGGTIEDQQNYYENGSRDAGVEGSRLVIYFPVLPDTVEIARTANYSSMNIMTLPDGFHLYQYNEPIKVPIVFKLHAFDTDYCTEGPVTLLKIAAALHALELPIVSTKTSLQFFKQNEARATKLEEEITRDAPLIDKILRGTRDTEGRLTNVSPGDLEKLKSYEFNEKTMPANAAMDLKQKITELAPSLDVPSDRAILTQSDFKSLQDNPTAIFFPPVVVLDLISSGTATGVGVNFTGFIESVSTKLNGPWLSGSGDIRNLPSSLECSFTIVHSPSQTNNFNQTGFKPFSANGPDIQQRFLNTLHLDGAPTFSSFGLGQIQTKTK